MKKWIVGTVKESGNLAVWPIEATNGQKCHPICIVSPADSITDTDLDNAALIAAAPEMLEALLACEKYMHDLEIENFQDENNGIFQDNVLTEAYGKLFRVIQKTKQRTA